MSGCTISSCKAYELDGTGLNKRRDRGRPSLQAQDVQVLILHIESLHFQSAYMVVDRGSVIEEANFGLFASSKMQGDLLN